MADIIKREGQHLNFLSLVTLVFTRKREIAVFHQGYLGISSDILLLQGDRGNNFDTLIIKSQTPLDKIIEKQL